MKQDWLTIETVDGETVLTKCSQEAEGDIVIPEGVTSIGNYAFNHCTKLSSVVIPESVETIGLCAFAECKGLVSIKIPKHVSTIDNLAFFACKSLTSIEIPVGIECLGVAVFSICTSLDSIRVSPDNKVYDSRENCNAIIETASGKLIAACRNTVFPAGITSIEEEAFRFCDSLTSLVIPDGVTFIGSWAFSGCISLRSVYIPDSVKEIDVFAFQGCFALKSLRLPDGVKVREFAFDDCVSLSEESLERIDDLFESLAVKYGVE